MELPVIKCQAGSAQDRYERANMKRGHPHLHQLMFVVDSDDNMKEVNENKRHSNGSITQTYKNSIAYKIGVTRSESSTNIRGVLDIVVYLTHVRRDEAKVILSASAQAITIVDEKYIKNIISNLDEDSLFKPLQVGERMYRCLIPEIRGVPVHIFKNYSARTIPYPSIDHVEPRKEHN